MEILPKWLKNPTPIEPSLTEHSRSLEDFQSLLSPQSLAVLRRNDILSLFPVQCEVIPHLLKTQKMQTHPGDICVNAPTGSGKTLAYVIPIIEVRRLYDIQ
jgi:ATP-dependent RNA helicase DDX51/DBP6